MPAPPTLHAAAFPRRVSIEPTNHCNQRCVLCPRQGFTRPLGFLAMPLFERIADECAEHETAIWLHFLGEPLLHHDLVPMIRYAKRVGVRQVGLSTNAVSLHGDAANALLDSGLDRLECSMDANERDGYRAMRGRDHFTRVEANLRAFLREKLARGFEKPVTSVQFMRTPEVEADLDALVGAWRADLGPHDFVMTIRPAPFGGTIATEPLPAPTARPPCAWLFSSVVITQDGTVLMCGADWDARAPLGHLDDAKLGEIWRGAEAERRRRAHHEGRFADAGPCGTCQDWRLADGSGYANALEEVEQRHRVAAGGA